MLGTFQLGMTLGLSIIISIGAQNLFVIRQAVRHEHPYLCALTCFICDFTLIILSVMGLSAILMKLPYLKIAILVLGILFLTKYDVSAIMRGWNGKSIMQNLKTLASNESTSCSLTKLILTGLSLSFLNPQAILDTTVIIGSSANLYVAHDKYLFIIGTITASLVWFFSLTMTIIYFSKRFINYRFWQMLEFISGGLMLAVAGSFLLQLVS